MSTQARIESDVAGPCCPFCGAGWTEAMFNQYDAMLDPHGCACCGSAGIVPHDRPREHEARIAAPMDLSCESCGRAIYQALASL